MLLVIVVTALGTLLLAVVAMNFVTPEKKIQRKVEHRFPINDAQFPREMSVMMGPSIVPGNRVTALQNGDEIFPAMLEAIRGAKVSIAFETYIYWSGKVGEEFTEALSERARVGIQVCVTVDWAGSLKMDDSQLERMEDAGVRLHRYRPLHWYHLGRMNNRTHRKLLVVDGKVAFTGGVGVADQWLGHAEDPEHWRDSHYRVEGPVVAQFQAAFNDNWIKMTGEVLNGPEFFPALKPVGEVSAHLFTASPAGGAESMHLMYMLAIAAAVKYVDLCAAYFIPDKLTSSALRAAQQRGVKVRILLPGEHIDSAAVRLRSRASWGTLLEVGVEIYEYQPTMLHGKMIVIDDCFVSVGSTNFDARSFRLNDEASLNVYDRALALEMTRVFEEDLTQAKPYTLEQWKSRPLWEKIGEKVFWPIRSQL
jgi:cardiolipin synthase